MHLDWLRGWQSFDWLMTSHDLFTMCIGVDVGILLMMSLMVNGVIEVFDCLMQASD